MMITRFNFDIKVKVIYDGTSKLKVSKGREVTVEGVFLFPD